MTDRTKVYLDFAATTPLDQRVLDRMLFFFSDFFGNPSSVHEYGQVAAAAVDNARQVVADLLECSTDEILFTSGGTESDNLAVRGVSLAERKRRGANHILISPVEHHAVSQTAEQLQEEFGYEVEYLPVDRYGMVDPVDVKKKIRRDTALVSVIYANNEIGTLNPIYEIGEVCHAQGVAFHTDAVQAAGFFPLDTKRLPVDLISIGAHKFYGPKGVGVLYVRKGTRLQAVQTGGGQERNLRAGTENVPYLVGLAEAYRYISEERDRMIDSVTTLRDHVIDEVLKRVPEALLTGHPTFRLPNHASFVFKGVNGNHLLMLLDAAGFACSSGSACRVGNPKPSEVLLALGCDPEWAMGSLRVTLGKGTREQDIDAFLDVLPGLVEKSRRLGVAV